MLPVAELHLHLEGTIEADLLIALARRNDVTLPSYDPVELTARYDQFGSLQDFLDVHYANLAVLRTEQDFYDLASSYLSRADAAGVRHAEMFCDPQTHLGNGVALGAMFDGFGAAIADARSTTGISSRLIVCFLRDLGGEAAEELIRAALPFRDQFIGVGLDSSELGYPPRLFERAYDIARAEGLHRVAHAGEEGGPDYVWEALDVLGVERIDHGNRALEDPALLRRLVEEQVPLTVCPLSNVFLKVVADLADHPLPQMLEHGLLVTINSDDPAYFGGGVDANLTAVRETFALSEEVMAGLAANSFRAAFVPEANREGWLAEIAAYAGSAGSAD